MKLLRCRAVLLIGLSLPLLGFAADASVAGRIKLASAEVTLQRGALVRPALAGRTLQVEDIVRTGGGSSASLTLSDDSLLSLGPNSELAISEFRFDSTTHDGGMRLSLWRGAMSLVTGWLAREAPAGVNVRTRTVLLGVRGTEFIVDTAGTP